MIQLRAYRDFEQRCADEDLFCIGYLIPLVELLEVEMQDKAGTFDQWSEWYVEFTDQCMNADAMTGPDVERIRQIMDEVKR